MEHRSAADPEVFYTLSYILHEEAYYRWTAAQRINSLLPRRIFALKRCIFTIFLIFLNNILKYQKKFVLSSSKIFKECAKLAK